MLTPIAPWLVPPDWIGAMTKGATMGLDSARLAQEGQIAAQKLLADQQEAAGRLGLGYANAAAQQQNAAAELALKDKVSEQVEVDRQKHLDTEAQRVAGENARPIHAPPGTTLLDPITRKPVYTAPSNPLSTVGKLQQDLKNAQAAGDTERVAQLNSAIQEAITNKGQSIYMGTDDQGKPIFQMTSGGGKPIGSIGPPTVATQSLAQRKILQYGNSTQLINSLLQNLRPEDVGARGIGGQMLVDQGLAQIMPELANTERVDNRTVLKAASESLMREISDDQRFSKADRDEISKALPSSGVLESYPSAIQKLKAVKAILAQRGKAYSQSIGQNAPLWSMTPDEIRSAFKAGQIKEDEAVDALTKFH